MKARLQTRLPIGSEWVYEVKLDGIRAIAIKDGEQIRLFSRLPRELTGEYPHLLEAMRRLPAIQLVIDGEIVALDKKGNPSFQSLQNRRREPGRLQEILLYCFDLLNLNGRDLKNRPLVERRKALAELLKGKAGPLKLSPSLNAPAHAVWQHVQRLGLEGIIAKRKDSVYETGRRSGAWVKVKSQMEQEFVIGGYTPPEGSRKYFGSLVVGYYDGTELIYAGRVGTGFDFETLRTLHQAFQPLRTPACPFANVPTKRAGRNGQGMTASEMKRCTWIRPELVGQVRFLEWTRDGNLRQPVFVGLREDKRPTEVVREGSR